MFSVINLTVFTLLLLTLSPTPAAVPCPKPPYLQPSDKPSFRLHPSDWSALFPLLRSLNARIGPSPTTQFLIHPFVHHVRCRPLFFLPFCSTTTNAPHFITPSFKSLTPNLITAHQTRDTDTKGEKPTLSTIALVAICIALAMFLLILLALLLFFCARRSDGDDPFVNGPNTIFIPQSSRHPTPSAPTATSTSIPVVKATVQSTVKPIIPSSVDARNTAAASSVAPVPMKAQSMNPTPDKTIVSTPSQNVTSASHASQAAPPQTGSFLKLLRVDRVISLKRSQPEEDPEPTPSARPSWFASALPAEPVTEAPPAEILASPIKTAVPLPPPPQTPPQTPPQPRPSALDTNGASAPLPEAQVPVSDVQGTIFRKLTLSDKFPGADNMHENEDITLRKDDVVTDVVETTPATDADISRPRLSVIQRALSINRKREDAGTPSSKAAWFSTPRATSTDGGERRSGLSVSSLGKTVVGEGVKRVREASATVMQHVGTGKEESEKEGDKDGNDEIVARETPTQVEAETGAETNQEDTHMTLFRKLLSGKRSKEEPTPMGKATWLSLKTLKSAGTRESTPALEGDSTQAGPDSGDAASSAVDEAKPPKKRESNTATEKDET